MSTLLGCIADDFTGATDLAGTLTRAGMRTILMNGVPKSLPSTIDADAIVVALKSRTIPAEQAIRQSLQTLVWLKSAGCQQFVFKYCSTFDSNPEGNIGQVSEALLEALGADFTIACPAFPRNGRLVFKGHLFVGDRLLNESGMQDHPLTPMTDANLVRVLEQQTKGSVGLVDYTEVAQGVDAVRTAFERLRAGGQQIAIIDSLSNGDLDIIASAARDLVLVTGGSGIGSGLAENFFRKGLLSDNIKADILPPVANGSTAILSGSCSRATQAQVAFARKHYPSFKIDPMALAEGSLSVSDIMEWATEPLQKGPILVYSTDDPDELGKVQETLGKEQSGLMVEQALSTLAVSLVDTGVRKLIVAGGETSGAVVQSLGVTGLRIGKEIDPGVPWTQSLDEPRITLALKSGNFGTEDFFVKASAMQTSAMELEQTE